MGFCENDFSNEDKIHLKRQQKLYQNFQILVYVTLTYFHLYMNSNIVYRSNFVMISKKHI